MLGLLLPIALGYALGVQRQIKKDVAERQAAGLPLPHYQGGLTRNWRALLAFKEAGVPAQVHPMLPPGAGVQQWMPGMGQPWSQELAGVQQRTW